MNTIKCWLCALLAIVFASLTLPANAAPEVVTEIKLAPGNWLSQHYARMPVEYKKAHPYDQWMAKEACFLKDRACTDADWKRVKKGQKIFIPVEAEVKVATNETPPEAIKVAEAPDASGFYKLEPLEPFVSKHEVMITTELATLKEADTNFATPLAPITSQVTILAVLSALLVLIALILAFRLRSARAEIRQIRRELSQRERTVGILAG